MNWKWLCNHDGIHAVTVLAMCRSNTQCATTHVQLGWSLQWKQKQNNLRMSTLPLCLTVMPTSHPCVTWHSITCHTPSTHQYRVLRGLQLRVQGLHEAGQQLPHSSPPQHPLTWATALPSASPVHKPTSSVSQATLYMCTHFTSCGGLMSWHSKCLTWLNRKNNLGNTSTGTPPRVTCWTLPWMPAIRECHQWPCLSCYISVYICYWTTPKMWGDLTYAPTQKGHS